MVSPKSRSALLFGPKRVKPTRIAPLIGTGSAQTRLNKEDGSDNQNMLNFVAFLGMPHGAGLAGLAGLAGRRAGAWLRM